MLADRTYPEGHWFRDSDGFHAEVDGYEQDGATRFGMIHHSEVAPGSVNIGNILFANATNLTCEWADWHDKRESLWKSTTLHRDRLGRLAQEIGLKILDAMGTLSRNPQPFTAGIGEWQLHGEIGIYHLNRDAVTGKYPPVDIPGWWNGTGSNTLRCCKQWTRCTHHSESDRPPFPGNEP